MSEGKRRRMTLPKKREDIERVMHEVEQTHHHEHHHHHEEAGLGEVLTAFEYILDSINANVKVLEATVNRHTVELAALYKILSKIVEACFSENPEARDRALSEALKMLGSLQVEKT